MRTARWIAVAMVTFSLALLWIPGVLNSKPKLIYNPSQSAPIGWYRVHSKASYERGDVVVSWLPQDAQKIADQRGYLPTGLPVIKTIWAISGDEICVSDGFVSMSEQPSLPVHLVDRVGRQMPRLLDGCRRLNGSHIFLASTSGSTSFDSRYFGPVDASLIVGEANYLGDFEGLNDRWFGDMAWARVFGADCKIKGDGPLPNLMPCLHITFYGPETYALGLRFARTAMGTGDMEGPIAVLPPQEPFGEARD